jgi:hypothetical protein
MTMRRPRGLVALLWLMPGVVHAEPAPLAGQSQSGALGLFRMSTAEVGTPGQLRLGLRGEFFQGRAVLVTAPGSRGDEELRLGAGLGVGVTPLRQLELHGALAAAASRNRRICADAVEGGQRCVSEPGRTDPEVMKAPIALTLGGKLAFALGAGLGAGAELGVILRSSESSVAPDLRASSVSLTGLGGWDLRAVTRVPVRAHLALGFLVDHSTRVKDLDGAGPASRLVTAFAYGSKRSRARGAVGLDTVLRWRGLGVRPSLEYAVELVTGAGDPAFADFGAQGCDGTIDRPCRHNRDGHALLAGLTVQMGSGLMIGAGVEIALRDVGLPYGPPAAPYNLMLTVGDVFALARGSGGAQVATAPPVVPRSQVAPGVVVGRVVAAVGGAPVDGARISVLGRTLARVASDPDGSFRLAGLPAGDVGLEIAAPHLETARVVVGVVAGKAATLAVSLPPATSRVTGRILDGDGGGGGVAARVYLRGPDTMEVKADESGRFSVRLPAGEYRVRALNEQHLAKEAALVVKEGEDQDLGTLRLRARPAAARVTLADGAFRFSPALQLAPGPDAPDGPGGPHSTLGPEAEELLDELVDLLLGHPEVTRIRIEAHWDRSLKAEQAQRLTYQQASAVADYLAGQGIARERMAAMGMGSARPSCVPNGDRTQDRRVEIHAEDGPKGAGGTE